MAKETPHLDAWKRTFKSVIGSVGTVTSETLKGMMPNITNTAQSVSEIVSETKEFASKSKNQISGIAKELGSSKSGRDAMNILSGAFSDIEDGNYSLSKLEDDAYDTLDDTTYNAFDDNGNESYDDDSTSFASAMRESSKNTAILGRVVAEGNAASIEGMRYMTNTISKVNIKTSNAAVAKMTNVALTSLNHVNAHMMHIEKRLIDINANLSAMVGFQNETQLSTNQAAVEYYNSSFELFGKMGEALASLQDASQHMRKTKLDKYGTDRTFDVSSGFNFQAYKEFVKGNYEDSMIGAMLGLVSSMAGLVSIDDMMKNPLQTIGPMIMEEIIPKNLKKSIERFDNVFTTSLDNILYRIGDLANDTDMFISSIGSIFG